MEYKRQRQQDVSPADRLGGRLLSNTTLLTLCCLICLIVTVNLHAASGNEILVIKSGSDKIYAQVIETFDTTLQQQCAAERNRCGRFHLQTVTLNESAVLQLQQKISVARTLIITVGSGAAKFVNAHKPSAPVLNTLIPRQTFKRLTGNANTSKRSAIYLDQPIQRQLRLIREAMPKRKRVGVLIGQNSNRIKREITRLSKKYGLKPQFGVVSDETKIGSVLAKLMEKSDVLLALPDPLIFNRHTVRNILLSSYHRRIPVIGFSEAYVNAGAIASAFSSPEDIGWHMGDLVASFLANRRKTLPKPVYPKYYSIKCNKRVANSLQIHLPPVEHLNHSPGRQPE